jgi:glycosyltransferase involved in cell wall biosynthesis
MSDPVDLSVVLPCFEEELAIAGVIREVRDALAGWPGRFEILVVDDASGDRTAELAEREGARVVRRVERGGSGAARKTGLREARGAVVAMLDADGSYVPKHLPELLAWLPAYDQVNGARTSEQGTLPWLRSPAKWAIRKLAEWVSGRRIPDLNTGMKVMKREPMLRYLWAVPDGFSCVTTMTMAFLCNGHPVRWAPVEYRPRIGRSKFHPVKDAASYLATVFRIVFYFRPLRVFVPAALAVAVFGIARGLHNRYATPAHSLQESDIIVMVFAAMILVVGMLAELIAAHAREPL